jgi:hypothetical protein
MPGPSETTTYWAGPSESYTEAVVNAVATVSNRSASPSHDGPPLDSLYDSIDPDALEALFERSGEEDGDPVTVTFTYSGYRVTVDDSGAVTVTEP